MRYDREIPRSGHAHDPREFRAGVKLGDMVLTRLIASHSRGIPMGLSYVQPHPTGEPQIHRLWLHFGSMN